MEVLAVSQWKGECANLTNQVTRRSHLSHGSARFSDVTVMFIQLYHIASVHLRRETDTFGAECTAAGPTPTHI